MGMCWAAFISGSGTTAQNLIARSRAGTLDAEISLVVGHETATVGLERAAEAGVQTQCVALRGQAVDAYSQTFFDICRRQKIGWVALAGFLRLIRVPDDFTHRVLNIHPSLIPAFCGKGYYGLRVHQAVLDRGVKVTGATVHFVDNEYDHGPILVQRAVDVKEDDSAESLAKRVFAAECEIYPEAIQLIAQGRVQIVGQRAHLLSKG